MGTILRSGLPYLAYAYLSLVKFTTRLKISGEKNRAALRENNQRFIYAFWHNRQMFFTCSHRQDNLSVLVSLSRDGELIAKVMSLSKIRASRGSSSRHASGAIKEMMSLVNEGFDLGITPDGPKGPVETAKLGAVFLAQKLGIPVLPTSNALSQKLVIKKSWDRYQIPLPFGRAVIAYATPILVGPEDDLKEKASELTKAIDAASAGAEDAIQKESGGVLVWFVLLLENLLSPLIGLFIFFKFLFSRRRRVLLGLRNELRERFGFSRKSPLPLACRQPIWIHAASAGEVTSIAPFMRLLKEACPKSHILLTSTNAQGVAYAKNIGICDDSALAPLDFSSAVRRFIRERKPAALILVETELWPHLIEFTSRENIPVCLIGATLSEKSFNRYRRLSFLTRPFLKRLALIAVQSQTDRERFELLGADPRKIIITGSLKYDALADPSNTEASKSIAKLGWEKAKIFVAASTHPGEEEIILAAYAKTSRLFPDLKLVIAPRHVERSSQLRATLNKMGISSISWSELEEGQTHRSAPSSIVGADLCVCPDSLLLDVLGVLPAFYDSALLSFVGGTLIDLGGHNLIEPALRASPLAFGPSTHSNAELSELLLNAGAGFRVKTSADLSPILERLISDPELRLSCGARAKNIAQNLRGASAKTLEALKTQLKIYNYSRHPGPLSERFWKRHFRAIWPGHNP